SSLRAAGPGHRPFEEPAGHGQGGRGGHEMSSHVSLRPAAPGTFEIHPAYQRHRFSIAGFVGVAETTFLPMVGDGDPPVVYQMVELRNDGALAQDLRIFGFARLRGTLAGDVQARYDPDLRALVAHNAGRPDAVRVFGVTESPSGYVTSFDFGRVYEPLHV